MPWALAIALVALMTPTVRASGATPALAITVSGTVQFGSFRVGTSEATAPPASGPFNDRFTVTNSGTANVQIDGAFATVAGETTMEYASLASTGNEPTNLPACLPGLNQPYVILQPGQSCVLPFAFVPSATGDRLAHGQVIASAPCNPGCGQTTEADVTVDGQGTDGYALGTRGGTVKPFGDLAETGLPAPVAGDASPVVTTLLAHPGPVPVTVHADGSVSGGGFDHGPLRLKAPIVGAVLNPESTGLYLVASDGGVFTFGTAMYHGSAGSQRLAKPIVGIALDGPFDNGYWLVGSDGGVFTFGDAPFFGSTGAMHLARPVVGIAAHITAGTFQETDDGYWLVAADGGIFSFGKAPFFGSAGAEPLVAPVMAMATTYNTDGYWLVAADGGVFNYGAAPFDGSAGGAGNVVSVTPAHPLHGSAF